MEFCIEDGVLWDFKCDNVQGNIVIPHGVKVIGEAAFAHCPSLFRVTIPGTVERIEREAFLDCPELVWVLIPYSVKYIGPYAFADCRKLNNVSIPESVTEINSLAFWIHKPWDEYLTGGPYYIYGKRGSAAESFAKKNSFIFKENKADKTNLMIGERVYDRPDLTSDHDGNIVLIRLYGCYEWGISAEGYPFECLQDDDVPFDSDNYFKPIPWIDLYARIDEMLLLARSNDFMDWSDEYERIKKMVMELPKTDPDLLKTVVSVETPKTDRYAGAIGTPSPELTRRAAQGVFDAYPDWREKAVVVACGSGSNSGVGYALAEILNDQGIDVRIYNASGDFSEDGAYYYKRCVKKNIPVLEWIDIWLYDVFVDCLLGTGFRGVPGELIAEVIRDINYARECYGRIVISVDINSGINKDTGEAELAVASNLTVSGGSIRKGLLQCQARELIGKLVNVDSDGTLRTVR